MPDAKITALTAISVIDPAVDPLPIVDVSDTAMAASGTTKKITINQILGASGTATLASATITGDLTVDTSTLKVDSANNRVGIGTATPDSLLQMAGAGTINWKLSNTADSVTVGAYAGTTTGTTGTVSNHPFFMFTNNTERYRLASDGVATWSNVGGVAGTAMTLNSTGLGVGVTPLGRLHVRQTGSGIQDVGLLENAQAAAADVGPRLGLLGVGSVAMATVESGWNGAANTDAYLSFRTRGSGAVTERLRIDASGNVGIGVTPSAWNTAFRGLDISTGGAIAGSSDSVRLFSNSAFNTAGNNVYKSTAAAGRYDLQGNVHTWNIAPSGTAGTTITFTPAMTLDGNGNLILQSSATPATLTTNGQLTVNATSNTNLRFSYRGSDGVTRVANITLA